MAETNLFAETNSDERVREREREGGWVKEKSRRKNEKRSGERKRVKGENGKKRTRKKEQ